MSDPAPIPREASQSLLLRTAMICLSIIVVGGAGLFLFFERLGDLGRDQQHSQILGALPEALRPPSRAQMLVYVSSDGRALHPRLEAVAAAGAPRSEQLRLLADKVLRAAAEEGGLALPFTLRAIYETEGLVIVDLSREGADDLDFRGECLLAYALVNSIADNFDDVAAVRFLIEGMPAETLAGALDITVPLVPNAALRVTN